MGRIAEGTRAAISGTLLCLCGLFCDYCAWVLFLFFAFFPILLVLQHSVGGRAEMV